MEYSSLCAAAAVTTAQPEYGRSDGDRYHARKSKGMKRFSMTLRLLRRNWKAFLGFETLYKLAVTALFLPLLTAIFALTIRAAGLTYLSTEAIKAYLLHPVTIVCLFLMLLMAAFISLFDMQAVICCCRASQMDRDITMPEMVMAGATHAKDVLFPKNWLVILFVVLIVPFSNVAAQSGLISQIELPEFIEDYINANTALHLAWIVVTVLLSLLALRWCYSLHAFTLENKSFLPACRESAHLTKKHLISLAVGTAVVGILLEVLLFLLGCVCLGLLFVGVRFLCPAGLRFPVASYALLGVVSAGSFLSMAFAVPGTYAYLSVRYYEVQPQLREGPDAVHREVSTRGRKTARIVSGVLCAAILCSAVLQGVFAEDMQDAAEAALRQPEIAAHRGSSVTAPENSMPAFRQAIADRADWIELDVHQTKDGVVVVTHDESIKRIAGVSKNVWELTYAELMQYDVGSWFSKAYADLRVATLDEVLQLCKGKIKLNIELKPTGHEQDFEQHVLDLIHANGYEEGEYILASLNADALKTLKRLEPEVRTLYIMTLAVGNVKDIPFADAFSVEESSITTRLVKSVHRAGKQIYVWTVNRGENVEKMMELDVDCIISDDPVMVRAALTTAPLSDDLQSIVALIFPEGAPQTDAGEAPAI